MNQHRWTCLTTLVFTTVLAPFATVNAKTLTALVPVSGDNQVPLASRSLPIVTPLQVTELQTDVAVPMVNRVVPAVSQLPVVKPIATRTGTAVKKSRFSLQERLPVAQPYPASVSAAKFTPTNISFNTQIEAIEPLVGTTPQVEDTRVVKTQPSTPVTQPQAATPSKAVAAKTPVIKPQASTPSTPSKTVAVKPSVDITQPQAPTAFTTSKAAPPIAIVGSDGIPSAQIVNSATVRAEIATTSQPVPSVAPLDPSSAPTTYRPETLPVPQPAPIIATSTDRAEVPSFEAGAPVFIFDSERPQQIVTTTIAQIGEETVAAEPSIAIPVQRPKQDTIPPQSAVPVKPAQQPQVKSIVTIEQPTETVQPAPERIVLSTHTGKASWYGSEGGSRTANGERYNPNGLTAAHRTLPFGTKVRVTSIKTGKSAIVRINDRGPFIRNRIIDVSAATAAAIGIKADGIGEVKMEVLGDDI
jgi:rare lipoprotein A